jgi:hypothetical protein
MFRRINWVMAALFAMAAAVQYNDLDPWRWIGIYGAAMIVTAAVARRGMVPIAVPLVVGAVALGWGLFWARDVTGATTYAHMFDHWKMSSVPVEEARETSGLVIVAGWMAVVAGQGWRRARARRGAAHDGE